MLVPQGQICSYKCPPGFSLYNSSLCYSNSSTTVSSTVTAPVISTTTATLSPSSTGINDQLEFEFLVPSCHLVYPVPTMSHTANVVHDNMYIIGGIANDMPYHGQVKNEKESKAGNL